MWQCHVKTAREVRKTLSTGSITQRIMTVILLHHEKLLYICRPKYPLLSLQPENELPERSPRTLSSPRVWISISTTATTGVPISATVRRVPPAATTANWVSGVPSAGASGSAVRRVPRVLRTRVPATATAPAIPALPLRASPLRRSDRLCLFLTRLFGCALLLLCVGGVLFFSLMTQQMSYS